LRLFGSRKPESYSLEFERSSKTMLRALVLPGRLDESAREAGFKRLELDEEERASLAELIAAEDGLDERLDPANAYRPPPGGALLDSLDLDEDKPETVVMVVSESAEPGSATLVQRSQDGEVVGGFTLEARRGR
jgi:hypothetical protein